MPVPTPQPRLARRERAIRAAARLLEHGGPTACTATSVAPAAALSRRELSQAFTHAEELLGLAARRLATQFLDRVEDAAAAANDPLEALWAASETYLRLALRHPAGGPVAGFDAATGPGSEPIAAAAVELAMRTERFFANLMAAIGLPHDTTIATAWLATLDGFVLRQRRTPRSLEAMLDALARAFTLPQPAATG